MSITTTTKNIYEYIINKNALLSLKMTFSIIIDRPTNQPTEQPTTITEIKKQIKKFNINNRRNENN